MITSFYLNGHIRSKSSIDAWLETALYGRESAVIFEGHKFISF